MPTGYNGKVGPKSVCSVFNKKWPHEVLGGRKKKVPFSAGEYGSLCLGGSKNKGRTSHQKKIERVRRSRAGGEIRFRFKKEENRSPP